MTLPKHSDKYGNPQVDPITREEVVQYTQDFYTKPQAVNHGHTIHEYWMEQSRGKIGVAVTTFGPYRMPSKTYQYGGGAEPAVRREAQRRQHAGRTRQDVDRTTRARTSGPSSISCMRLYAGYDESSVWQEFGEMKFQTKEDITPEFGNPDPSKPRLVEDALRRVDELGRGEVAVEQLARSSPARRRARFVTRCRTRRSASATTTTTRT